MQVSCAERCSIDPESEIKSTLACMPPDIKAAYEKLGGWLLETYKIIGICRHCGKQYDCISPGGGLRFEIPDEYGHNGYFVIRGWDGNSTIIAKYTK